MLQIVNQRNGNILAADAKVASSFREKLIGLLGTKNLAKGSALVLQPCKCVHMLFMRYPLDILFLDRQNLVCGLERELAPWRWSRYYFKAQKVIELPVGKIDESETELGDEVLEVKTKIDGP